MNIAILGGFPLFPKGRLASLIPAVTTTDSLDAQTIARLATDYAAAQLASGIRLNSSQAVAAVMSGETSRAKRSAVTTTDSLDAQTIARLATDHAAAQLASGIRLNSSQAVAAVMSGETVRAEHSTA